MGRKRAREMHRVEHGRIDRRLKVMAESGMRKEELQRPLILLVATRGAEGDPRLAVAQSHGWAESRPWSLTALDVVWVVGIEVEHLCPGAEAEAETLDHGRALQPTSAGSASDHVPEAIGHRNMNRVAPHLAHGLRAGARPVAFRNFLYRTARKAWLDSARRAWPELQRCAWAHQRAAGIRVVAGEQALEVHFDECGIRVPGFAVRERELRALDDRVNVIGGQKAGSGEVEALQQTQLLQENGALAPRPAFSDGPTLEVGRYRGLVIGPVVREIVACQEAGMWRSRAVHQLGSALVLDGFGDESGIERCERCIDLLLAAVTDRLRFAQQSLVGEREIAIAKPAAGGGDPSLQVGRSRRWPVGAEELLHRRDHIGDARHDRIPRLRVLDREV